MTKDLALSNTSQHRHIFLIFLDKLLPQISSAYFKQSFIDTYFYFKNDEVQTLLLHFVKLAQIVRIKSDDYKTVDRLESALELICHRHTNNDNTDVNKNANELLRIIEQT